MSDTDGTGSSGGALVRRTGAVVATVEGEGAVGQIVDWGELRSWGRRHVVLLAGLALVLAQVAWKGLFLRDFYFRQDDFHVFELAQNGSFSFKYLTFIGAGHLIPGIYAIAWVLVRLSLYNWALASAVTLVMLAGAGLAALRLLRTLFGNRPAILIPLVLYLMTPMTLPDDGWWSSAVESVPLQIAVFMALNAQVHYVRTDRFRHAVAAAAWLVFGMLFFEKAIVIPALLFGVTAGFLVPGHWLTAVRQSLTRYWRAWLMYLLILGAYAALFVTSLSTSSTQPGSPGSPSSVLTFVWDLLTKTFVPAALGGPWQWFVTSSADYGFSAPPAELAWLAGIVAVLIVLASIRARRIAWRAWVILLAWIAAADMAPVIIGRIQVGSPAVLGIETRYVADAAAVLAVAVGLAFLPVQGRTDDGGAAGRRPFGGSDQAVSTIVAGLVAVFVAGSIWSAQAYQNATTSVAARAYVANARAAVKQSPAGTLVFDQKVPVFLMLGDFGNDAYASALVGTLERGKPPAARLSFIKNPHGTLNNLMVFGADGRLHPVTIYGRVAVPPSLPRRCFPARGGQIAVPFSAPSPPGTRFLRIDYLASAQIPAADRDLSVSYGTSTQPLAITPGLHTAYLPEQGSTGQVTMNGPAVPLGLCIGDVQAGILIPSPTGTTVPATGR